MLQPDQWKQLQGMEKHMEQEITKMIRVYGIVQGVGFRPTVSRHAMARGIRGSVSNKGPYVEIFAQGKQQDVDAFIADIGNKLSVFWQAEKELLLYLTLSRKILERCSAKA